MSWLFAGLRFIVFLLIVLLAIATFLPLIDIDSWWVRFLSFPRIQFLYALVALFLLTLALPRRFRLVGALSILIALGAIAYQFSVLAPYSVIVAPQALTAHSCPEGNQLKLLEVNLKMTNERDRRLFDEIDRNNPDVIFVQELDDWWASQFAQLHGKYPYFKQHAPQDSYGLELLSRYRLVDPQIIFPAGSHDPAVIAGVVLPAGETIVFNGVNPRPPVFGQSSAERDAELMDVALRMNEQNAASVIAGDFSATPWTAVVRRTARLGRLLDPRIGRGMYPTWKANAIVRRWPLDNVLFADKFTLLGFRVLPPFGSDHQPTLTTVCYAPEAARLQTAPQPTSEDFAVARRSVAASKAVPSPVPKPEKEEPEPQ
ncbi:MAG: endonuclease/exonuclease/phosphatase family protein [Methylocystis sp.]